MKTVYLGEAEELNSGHANYGKLQASLVNKEKEHSFIEKKSPIDWKKL